MASVRLSPVSLQNFDAILNTYRDETNAQRTFCCVSFGGYGKKKLAKIDEMLAEYHADATMARYAFLKKLAAFAYADYKASWTKASDGLSAQILSFVARELKIERTERMEQHIVPYARPFDLLVTENDKDFFKRVNEAVNPTAPVVKRFAESGSVFPRAGYPVLAQDADAVAAASKARHRSYLSAQEEAATRPLPQVVKDFYDVLASGPVFPRAGIPILQSEQYAKHKADQAYKETYAQVVESKRVKPVTPSIGVRLGGHST
jgi:hypothetical protein